MPALLDIERMTSTYVIPADQPSAEPVRARLDAVAARDLPSALGSIVSAICPAEDSSVWLIQRLEVSIDVNGDWDPERLARAWAIAVARALARVMRAPDGLHAIRFDSREEYLAALLSELAEGSAWGSSRFAAFEGLKMLSSSAALRTIIVDPTEPGVRALSRLGETSLKRVLAALTGEDAATITRQCFRTANTAPGAALLGAVAAAWSAERHAAAAVAGEPRRAVWWIARLTPAVAHATRHDDAMSAIAAMVALDRHLEMRTALDLDVLRERPGVDDSIADLVTRATSGVDRHLRVWTEHAELLQTLLAETGAAASAMDEWRTESMTTAFGGVFWLLPLLDALPVEEWCDTPHLFRFLAFASCCPHELRADAVRDGGLRDLFGVRPDEDTAAADAVRANVIEAWLRADAHPALDEPFDEDYFGAATALSLASHAVLRLFAWKLAGFGRASARHLWMNCLNVGARVESHHDRRLVTMGRPPLDVVLRLAGLSHTSYIAPHIDSRPFVLIGEE